ncbi:MAG: sugar transferase [Nitrosomonadales bacterium]|jgi:O-antigen biosynthesis protein WbqP|nr:sugar transferase [Nitrosomonadales bacterium]
MKRFFDFLFSLIAFAGLILLFLLIAFLIKLTSDGPILHWSDRVGRKNRIFKMPKFRSMYTHTPDDKATHLLQNPDIYITKLGKFLRLTSLDEIPQFICVISGEMSLVGPRPALFNQKDLIELRKLHGVDNLLPGITGWAQINGRDKLSIHEKVKLDVEYMNNQTIFLDIKILWFTIFSLTKKNKISH